MWHYALSHVLECTILTKTHHATYKNFNIDIKKNYYNSTWNTTLRQVNTLLLNTLPLVSITKHSNTSIYY